MNQLNPCDQLKYNEREMCNPRGVYVIARRIWLTLIGLVPSERHRPDVPHYYNRV